MMDDMNTAHGNHSGMALPPCTKLHVVLHGLICARLSYATRTVQLHFPSVPMHVYHYGSFGKFGELPYKALAYGYDYQLGGVQVGHFRPDKTGMKYEHLAICLNEYPELAYHPRGTHATVTLPWPANVRGVRHITCPPTELFPGSDVNPRLLHYVTYLTYHVAAEDRPVLTKCCRPIWSSEALCEHTRLHFFADPWKALDVNGWQGHLTEAYGAVSDQIFDGKFLLKPNVTAPWHFANSEHTEDVPEREALDYCPPVGHGLTIPDPNPKAEGRGMEPLSIGDGGNCLPLLTLD